MNRLFETRRQWFVDVRGFVQRFDFLKLLYCRLITLFPFRRNNHL